MDKSSEILDGGISAFVTPAESTKSSKNILDILNDDCIRENLRRLTHLEDLVNAGSVCKRFRECAMSLKFMFRSVTIEGTRHLGCGKDIVSAHTAELLFKNFGHLIESVEWRLAGNHKRNQKLFKRLAKYCGKNLKKLKITEYNPCFDKRKQFPFLEQLILNNAEPTHFRLNSPLKHLEIRKFSHMVKPALSVEQPWFVRDFPHLESVCFNTTEITDDTLTDFLSFNPQLRALEVDSEYITPVVLKSIGFHSRNIERLQIKSVEFNEYDTSELNDELLHLSELRKLSEFSMPGRLSLEILMKMFAENNVPIRSLIEVDVAATGIGATFPTIETLNKLECICRSDVDESCLVNFVKSQPALQTLQIANIGSNITVGSIEKILKFGKNLTDFDLSSCHSDFDVETYNRILMLANNRVRVRIGVQRRRQVDVPVDILRANRKLLRIMFE